MGFFVFAMLFCNGGFRPSQTESVTQISPSEELVQFQFTQKKTEIIHFYHFESAELNSHTQLELDYVRLSVFLYLLNNRFL